MQPSPPATSPATNSKDPAIAPTPLRAALVWGPLGVVLAGTGLRAVTSYEPYPFWSNDPALLPSPALGLTPWSALVLDLATILASVIGWIALGRAPRWLLIGSAMFVPGLGVLAWHAVGGGATHLGDLTIGSAWTSAVFAAIFLAGGARDEWFRRVGFAGLLGVVAMLVVKGGAQYFIEHPRSVRTFLETKAQVLAAQGWREDSPMARAFERRAMQREATGWWGLSNVYGSVAAAGLGAMLGMLVAAWSGGAPRARGWLAGAAFAALSAAGLWFAQSKGAGLAAGAGALFALALWRTPRARWLGVLALLLPLGGMLLVVARGVVGERVGELSLLFRWFYAQGALRVLGEHPWLGVGPDGFQSAYLLVKNPLSPEAPTSPHSIALDWACAMGMAGVVWGGAWLALAWRVGVRAGEADPPEQAMPAPAPRIVLAGVLLPTLLASAWEREALTPDAALVRLLGLLLAGACGVWVLRVARARHVRWGLACAGASVLAHAPIEMTLSNPGSAAWALGLLALAGGARAPEGSGASWARWGVAGAGLMCAGAIAATLAPVGAWERALREGYEVLGPLRELGELRGSPAAGAREEYLSRLGRLVGGRVAPEHADAALAEVRRALLERASQGLTRASGALPSHFATGRSESGVLLDLAAVARDRVSAAGLVRRSLDLAQKTGESNPGLSPAWAWVGVVARSGWQLLGEGSNLERACAAWEEAARLDPGNAQHAVELARAYRHLGDAAASSRWACEALARDERLRLDPLVGLGEGEREEMRGLCGASGP